MKNNLRNELFLLAIYAISICAIGCTDPSETETSQWAAHWVHVNYPSEQNVHINRRSVDSMAFDIIAPNIQPFSILCKDGNCSIYYPR